MKRPRNLCAGENFENAALLSGISGCSEILRGSPPEDIARRIHPTACFGFVAEYFQRTAPNGIGARVLELTGELFGWSLAVHVSHNPHLSPASLHVVVRSCPTQGTSVASAA